MNNIYFIVAPSGSGKTLICNILKEKYNITFDEYNKNPCKENKLYLLYNCPVGLQLTARMTTNYRQFKTIYKQRKNHTLPEWREFCKWIETLPYAELITGANNKDLKVGEGANNG